MKDYYVEIVEYGTGEIVKSMGPMSERKANKVEGGANINLNHEEYFTRIINKSELQDANREMLGDDADYFEAAGIDDIGCK